MDDHCQSPSLSMMTHNANNNLGHCARFRILNISKDQDLMLLQEKKKYIHITM